MVIYLSLCLHVILKCQNNSIPVSNKDNEDKENIAVDGDVADPEAILNASEEQQLKTEEGEAEQMIPDDAEKVAEVVVDDDTSDEDVTSQGLPGTTQICPVGLATRIDKCISVIIIPKLYKALTQKVCNISIKCY